MSKIEAMKLARDMLAYDAESGFLTWENPPKFNSNLLSTRAGCVWTDGYRYIRIKREPLLEHRVAWFIQYGEEPDQLDHINTIRDDNRLCNLRIASITENNRNKGRQANNTSGYKGVTHHKASGKYQAKICADKKTVSLGYFDSALEAHQAYIKASGELHGQFGRG